jgi:thymidylate synthase
MEQVNLQLSRPFKSLPNLIINKAVNDIFSFKFEDFSIEGYDPHPAIKGAVAV